jgi:LacI family transcriptional regulator
MATLSDVAARAGVSVSAVSRVLSGASGVRVSSATRERIVEAARLLDYRPNYVARALKFSRTNVLALVVPDVANAIFAELMRGVEEEAFRLEFMVLLARTDHMPRDAIARLVGEGRVDGVLVQLGDSMSTDDVSALLSGKVPAVLINSSSPGHAGSVTLDDPRAAALAVAHLRDLGHRRIGLIGGLQSTDSARRRESGFRDAMSAANLMVDEKHITRLGYGHEEGAEAWQRVAAGGDPPTAVVVANVNAALGVLVAARRLGLRVPEDLSVVAIHDTWVAATAWPALTTVRMPLADLGRQAVTDLVARIAHGESVNRVIDTPDSVLVERDSTGPLRT